MTADVVSGTNVAGVSTGGDDDSGRGGELDEHPTITSNAAPRCGDPTRRA